MLICLLIWTFPIILAGCSGGDVPAASATSGATPNTVGGYAIYLNLSQTTIKTDTSDSAEITATLTKNNVAQPDQEVIFSATDGLLTSNSATTDANGDAKVTIRSGPGASNQIISISATSNGASVSIPLQITGNTLSLSIPQASMAQGSSQQLTATLKNANNVGIANAKISYSILSGSGVSLSTTSATTDANGKAIITINASPTVTGTAIIQASSLGASAQVEVTVAAAAQVFEITSPTVDPASLQTNSGSLQVTVNAPAQANVTFYSSLVGSKWNDNSNMETVAVVNGVASATLTATLGGTASITVYDPTNLSTQDTLQVNVYAPPSEAANLTLKATQNNVAVTPVGSSSVNSVTLTVVARNADNYAVGNALVKFTLSNTTGGGEYISPSIAVTNSAGEATSTFYSGSLGSSGTGVMVTATLVGTTIDSNPEYINITDLAGSIVIGRANKIIITDDTSYEQNITVQVSDSNGSPVPNALVTLNLWPIGYYLGAEAYDDNGTCVGYYHNYYDHILNAENCTSINFEMQPNEDVDRNFILLTSEDYGPYDVNAGTMLPDGALTPANSTAGEVPPTVTTDPNGMGTFSIKYLKQYGMWIEVELTASVKVQGTEAQAKSHWTLDVAEPEYEACDLFESPFGYFIPSPLAITPVN